jgi:hypothetical protein
LKNLITVCALVTALWLAWDHYDLSRRKSELESQALGMTQQIESMKKSLEATKVEMAAARAQLTPAQKQNWIEERNRNYQSLLNR